MCFSISFLFSPPFSPPPHLARLQRLGDHADNCLSPCLHGIGHGAHQAVVAPCRGVEGQRSRLRDEREFDRKRNQCLSLSASQFSFSPRFLSHLHTPGRCLSWPSRRQARRRPACTAATCPQTTRKRRRCAETGEELLLSKQRLLPVSPASRFAFSFLKTTLTGRERSYYGEKQLESE